MELSGDGVFRWWSVCGGGVVRCGREESNYFVSCVKERLREMRKKVGSVCFSV